MKTRTTPRRDDGMIATCQSQHYWGVIDLSLTLRLCWRLASLFRTGSCCLDSTQNNFLPIAYALWGICLNKPLFPASNFHFQMQRSPQVVCDWQVPAGPGLTPQPSRPQQMRDSDPLPGHVFLPLRGSSNIDPTAVTILGIQESSNWGKWTVCHRDFEQREWECPLQKKTKASSLFKSFNQCINIFLQLLWSCN